MSAQAAGFKRILEIFGVLKVPYQVVGSLASSMHGIPRATNDVDMVADLQLEQIADFVEQLKTEFYADVVTFARQQPFNLIHYASFYKFDIFPLTSDEYSQVQFARRQFLQVESLGTTCAVASAEDTVLNKLRCYRLGGETSDLQWNDLWGIIRIQGDTLDRDYMNKWAPTLGVADLLDSLLRGE